MSCVRTSFDGANVSAQSGRTTKPPCIIFAFFALREDTSKVLHAQTTAFLPQLCLTSWERYPAHSRMQRDTNQCVVTLHRLTLREKHTQGGALVSWRPVEKQTRKCARRQSIKRKVPLAFSYCSKCPSILRSQN